MPGTRDHDPLVIEDFAGWWKRGDPDSAPSDHFIQADNIQYFHSGVETRDGLVNYITNPLPPLQVLRIYNYVTQKGHTLIVLTVGGKIYHITGPGSVSPTPILTIPEMEDFGFVAINGRAFITPFKTYTNPNGDKYQLGIQNQFVYVYMGDGTPARKAAGFPPIGGALTAINSPTAGKTDPGLHILAIVYETDSGYLTGPGPVSIVGTVITPLFATLTFTGTNKIRINNIPTSSDTFVKKRHIVSSKAILNYNGDVQGYQLFFIPGAVLDNNPALPISTIEIEYFDSDLIADASHLIDNLFEIPAGVNLNTYHSRMIIVGEYGIPKTLVGLPTGITDNRSIARVSYPGEPESISAVDGLLIVPLDGQPLTNVQEFRDVLYLFKKTRTFAYSDNYDVPSSWQEEVLDQGIGAPVHGIATVLDTGGVNIDFLLVVNWSGLMLFNGVYAQPELSWKIEDYWRSEINRNFFHLIQIVNDSINKKLWMTLPEPNRKHILHADYSDGMDPKNIKWARWIFDIKSFAIALIETDRLVIGTPGPEYLG